MANANNIVFYFRNYDELEAFANAHPELWINVLGTTAKGWYKALVSRTTDNGGESNNDIPIPVV